MQRLKHSGSNNSFELDPQSRAKAVKTRENQGKTPWKPPQNENDFLMQFHTHSSIFIHLLFGLKSHSLFGSKEILAKKAK